MYKNGGVGCVGNFSAYVEQVSSTTLLGWYIVDWHHTFDRVSPPDIISTNPVQSLWNTSPRTQVSIFIDHKHDLDMIQWYFRSKLIIILNDSLIYTSYSWSCVITWYNGYKSCSDLMKYVPPDSFIDPNKDYMCFDIWYWTQHWTWLVISCSCLSMFVLQDWTRSVTIKVLRWIWRIKIQ